MPRLIRLYKDYNEGVPLGRIANFNNNFNSDLVLKPDSQIALQNISIDTVDVGLTIDAENSTVKWRITDDNDEDNEFEIAFGEYSSANYKTLTTALTNGFNGSTEFDMSTTAPELLKYYLGVEWESTLNVAEGSVLDIGYQIGELYWPGFINASPNVESEEIDDDRETISLVAPDNDYGSLSLEKAITSTKYLSKGCGCVRSQGMLIDNNGAGFQQNGNGFIVGLTNKVIDDPTTLVIGDIKYGIWYSIFDTVQRRYRVVVDGVVSTNATTQPIYTQADPTNDIQEVMINGDQIFFNIYQNGIEQPVLLNDDAGVGLGNAGVVPYSGEKLYPVLVLFSGDDFVSVDNWIATESQYQNKPTVPNAYYPDFGHALQPETQDGNTSLSEISNNYLEFETGIVAEFLGFDSRFNGPINSGPTNITKRTTRDFLFEAEKKFNPAYFADSFLVELKNISLDSYDGLVQQRKNVLAYISHSDADGTFNYEVNNPIYIDLNNKTDILLRNLEANLLYGDYSEFAIQSDASMTLLVKQKTDN